MSKRNVAWLVVVVAVGVLVWMVSSIVWGALAAAATLAASEVVERARRKRRRAARGDTSAHSLSDVVKSRRRR
jgi:Flp pilus assembly protein TadB